MTPLKAKGVGCWFCVVALLGLVSLGEGQDQKSRERDNKVGGSNKTGKLWTIKTSERLDPEFRKLLDGKTVREGLNPILVSKDGAKLSLRIQNGRVTELVAIDKTGQSVSRKKTGNERVGETVADCNYILDQCRLNCKAAGRYGDFWCLVDCWSEYVDCLNSSQGATEPFFFLVLN